MFPYIALPPHTDFSYSMYSGYVAQCESVPVGHQAQATHGFFANGSSQPITLWRGVITSKKQFDPTEFVLFENLAKRWKEETAFYSSVDKIVMNPNYQQIIGMGEKAISYILSDLERTHSHWFWALKAISGEDPVDDESKGDVKKMVEAWVYWGKQKGYV